MAESKYTELFRFEADGMPEDTFHVLSFRGTEALSSLFSFDVELVSKNMSLDLEELLSGNAKLTIKRGGGFPDAVFAGRPAAARQTGSFGEYAYYSVTLRPAFWKFTQLVQSAIFLNKTAPETVDELISEERGFPLGFEMRLTAEYPKQEFAMQHEEKRLRLHSVAHGAAGRVLLLRARRRQGDILRLAAVARRLRRHDILLAGDRPRRRQNGRSGDGLLALPDAAPPRASSCAHTAGKIPTRR